MRAKSPMFPVANLPVASLPITSRPIVSRLVAILFAAMLLAIPAQAATDPGPVDQSPYLANARALIKAKKYDAALAELKIIVVTHQNADVYTLLGHALWKTGDRDQGMSYYNKALVLVPMHRGALEYQGELYVAMGQVGKARENLAKLKVTCPFGCEELGDLNEAIEHAPKS